MAAGGEVRGAVVQEGSGVIVLHCTGVFSMWMLPKGEEAPGGVGPGGPDATLHCCLHQYI